MRAQSGVTLVELMVAVAILGLLVAAAAPSAREFIANTRVRSAVESLQAGVTLARNEALRRNENVDLVLAAGQWRVVRVNGSAELRASSPAELEGVSLSPATATMRFDGLGRASDIVGSVVASNLTVSNPTYGACQDAGGNVRCLRLLVRTGGASRVCDPKLAFATDPRGC
jgi:type IV fimbrial biogenesis protein FimT